MTNNMPEITIDGLIALLDSLQLEYTTLLDQLSLETPAPAEGEWTPRQVLSHVIGALNRTPIHAGYFFAAENHVPIVFHDPYWIPEWHGAPMESFKLSLRAAIEGNKAFIRSLMPTDLGRSVKVADWGEIPLGGFLMTSYQGHVAGQHIPQVTAFLTQAVEA